MTTIARQLQMTHLKSVVDVGQPVWIGNDRVYQITLTPGVLPDGDTRQTVYVMAYISTSRFRGWREDGSRCEMLECYSHVVDHLADDSIDRSVRFDRGENPMDLVWGVIYSAYYDPCCVEISVDSL